jgi:hypothetical protein
MSFVLSDFGHALRYLGITELTRTYSWCANGGLIGACLRNAAYEGRDGNSRWEKVLIA